MNQQNSPPSSEEKSTSALVAIGAAWFVMMRWTLRLIGLVSTAVLARVLVPADFGLVAIASSYLTLLEVFTDFGARSAVIRNDDENDRSFLNTVFTTQLIRGIGLAMLVFGSSVVPHFLGMDERVGAVIRSLAICPLLNSLQNPKLAVFERSLDFRRESALQILAKLLSTVTSITLAFVFRTYWALVAGLLVASGAKFVISYLLSPFLPRVGLKGWRELLGFSGWISATYMLDVVSRGFDNITMGFFVGARGAGLFNIGQQLAEMPLGEFIPVVNRALFPGLLRFKDSEAKLRTSALDALGLLSALSLPMAIGFALVAPEAVHLIYGKQWGEAIPVIQVLAVASAFDTIGGSLVGSVAMATAQTRLLFMRSLWRGLFRLPAFVVGTWAYGLMGGVTGSLIGSAVLTITNLATLRIVLRLGYRPIVERLWRAIVAVIVMVVVILVVQHATLAGAPRAGDGMRLTLKTAAGIASYGAVRLLIWKWSGVPDSLEQRLLALVATLRARRLKSHGRAA